MPRLTPLALLVLVTACKDDGGLDTAVEVMRCEVAIVGGGGGGVHTAFRLAPTYGDRVCLFEREAALGGRIKDVALDETDPTSPRVGVGARRVMEGQTVLLDLAAELSLTLERAQLAPGVTMRWDPVRVQGGSERGLEPTERRVAAKARFEGAVAAAGPGLADILWRVVCAGEALPDAERALDWPARSGKLVLKLALDRVAGFYRLG